MYMFMGSLCRWQINQCMFIQMLGGQIFQLPSRINWQSGPHLIFCFLQSPPPNIILCHLAVRLSNFYLMAFWWSELSTIILFVLFAFWIFQPPFFVVVGGELFQLSLHVIWWSELSRIIRCLLPFISFNHHSLSFDSHIANHQPVSFSGQTF